MLLPWHETCWVCMPMFYPCLVLPPEDRNRPTVFGRALEVATSPSRLLQMEKEIAGLKITCPFFTLFSHCGHRSHHSLINRGFGRRIDRLCCIVVITSSLPQSHHDSTGHCNKLWLQNWVRWRVIAELLSHSRTGHISISVQLCRATCNLRSYSNLLYCNQPRLVYSALPPMTRRN